MNCQATCDAEYLIFVVIKWACFVILSMTRKGAKLRLPANLPSWAFLAISGPPIPAFPVPFLGFWAAPNASAVSESPNSAQKSVDLI